MRILIVDGSKQRRLDLVESLGELTNVVVQGAVGDVRSALRAIVDASPDVVVTGALLPDGDGTHLIERVHRLQRAPQVVVVTGSDDQRDRYLAAGADHCVDNEDELRMTVAILARTRRANGSIPPLHTLELLGRMTAGVVHDLNNYIGVLGVMLSLIKRRPAEPELWFEAEAALDAIDRLNSTLLSYARGGAPARSETDLSAVVRDTVGLIRKILPTNISIELELDEVRPVSAVKTDLEQLVLNLVINACDAMPLGGALRVSVHTVPYGVLLQVADTGWGDATKPEPKHPGPGLGLGIVQAVVDRHRGALRVLARPEGGTKVAVMLPRAQS
jgi:signal transduction histidine kinase